MPWVLVDTTEQTVDSTLGTPAKNLALKIHDLKTSNHPPQPPENPRKSLFPTHFI